ncbi:hypothetical protein [Hyalangium versicolor]|uniref:hypothetical protein n=1 Tax=Hyalangium versicolor TaxID=2861190 RepID=UPI001CCFDC3B|nr:hypothetical protein [Hyalangium versicolor]
MERVRPPRPSDDAAPELIGPLPSSPSLAVLLDAVRSPAVAREDVDALLQGLAHPPSEDESPRSRADFLLSLITAPSVGDLQSTQGVTVRTAAVRALLDLGFPYALEVPPEALADALSARDATPLAQLPLPGAIATLAGVTVQAAELLPSMFQMANRQFPPAAWMFLVALSVVLGPAAMTVLSGLFRKRGLLIFGLCMMGLTSSFWLYTFVTQLLDTPFPLNKSATFISLVAGLGFLLGTFLLRPGAWGSDDETPDSRR